MIRTRFAIVAALLVLTGVGAAFAQSVQTSDAWIDSPLPKTLLPLGVVEVIAHAADSSGIVAARLDVDGITVAWVEPSNLWGTLADLRFEWTPEDPGVYELAVYGRTPNGIWTPPGITRVEIVGGDPEPSTTTSTSSTTTTGPTNTTTTTLRPPTTTTTRVATTTTTTIPTTTTTACIIGIPSPTGPSGTQTSTTVTLTWSYSGCAVKRFEIELSNPGGAIVLPVTTGGELRSINVGLPACGPWFWRIRTFDGGLGPWSGSGSFDVPTLLCT